MIRSFIYYFLSLIIFSSYVVGFYYMENSSGQAGDSIHIFNNYQLFQKYNLNNLPWMEYGSSSLPLYYLITSFFFDFKNIFSLRMFNLIIAISSFFIFYQILVNRFNFQILISNSITLFIILFLTSYNLDLKNRIFSYTFNQLNILQITDDVKKIDNEHKLFCRNKFTI